MTDTDERIPNGLAMPKPVHLDPWEEPAPLVNLFDTDTKAERRAAQALEAATRHALSQTRQP